MILPLCLLTIIAMLWQSSSEESFSYESFEGYITQRNNKAKQFFLQEHESGSIIELKFANEDSDLLTFDEFGYVIVDGHYNNIDNYIVVNAIEELRVGENTVDEGLVSR